MMHGDRFPWLSHRSLAEVYETEQWREKRRAGKWYDSPRLRALEARACEPPAEPQPPQRA